ncbi:MAG: hypothetical protein ACE5J4_00650 [Candidatus Aenigmatarchaeota archaeon]
MNQRVIFDEEHDLVLNNNGTILTIPQNVLRRLQGSLYSSKGECGFTGEQLECLTDMLTRFEQGNYILRGFEESNNYRGDDILLRETRYEGLRETTSRNVFIYLDIERCKQ